MKTLTLALFISSLFMAACSSKSETSSSNAEDARCSNCGMPYKLYPKWHARIIAGKQKHFCCSPRCMFTILNTSSKISEAVQEVKVIDYYELKEINGKDAVYVIGSDIIGPMGPDFVPFSSKEAAEEFKRDHKGNEILEFSDINLETVQQVTQ